MVSARGARGAQGRRVIAPDGSEWLPIAEAARRTRVRVSAVRNWASRGRVRSQRIKARTWVNVADVAAAEVAWRRRVSGRIVA